MMPPCRQQLRTSTAPGRCSSFTSLAVAGDVCLCQPRANLSQRHSADTLRSARAQPELVNEVGVQFGSALKLVSAELNRHAFAAGDLLQVATDLEVSEQAPELKFSLRLIDAAGNVTLSQDYTPQNWFAPTNVWLVGQPARDPARVADPGGRCARELHAQSAPV